MQRAAVLLTLSFGLAPLADAVPITYTLQVYGGNATGTLGTVPFSNAKLVYTFNGDTANVIPYSIVGPNGSPTTGYEILLGTASVMIFDGSGAVLTATFLPSAGIYVSVDNTNGGIGFGSAGVPPTSPTFPGEPAYPAGMFLPTGNTYNLTGYYDSGPRFAVACVGFAVVPTCQTPIALPTTAGDLTLNPVNISSALFSSAEYPVTPFASLSAQANVTTSSFSVSARIGLGAGSNGINPVGEAVSLAFGPYSVSIPQGSFRQDRHGNFSFTGTIDRVALSVQISPLSNGDYRLSANGSKVNLKGLSNPVSLDVTIGDDNGSTTVNINNNRGRRDD
jgi:hypothetical protein